MDNLEITENKLLCQADAWYWAYYNKIKITGGVFELKGSEWQPGIMQSTAQNKVVQKGAQLGLSMVSVLDIIHSLIYNMWPQGCLYLFPNSDQVGDFSKSRFNPLIADNPQTVGKFVKNTDSTFIKRIGDAFLYMRGARLTSNIEGLKADSAALRSISVDSVYFDEIDLMSEAAIDLALERMSHSSIQQTSKFSTPTIPDWGINKYYLDSSQNGWLIKCNKCNGYTCLEDEFPNCIKDGKTVCVKCGNEIFSRDGVWVPRYKEKIKDCEGWHISQLNSSYISPQKILDLYNKGDNLQEVLNSKLGLPYIAQENRLTKDDVYACCCLDGMEQSSYKNNAMGVDIGKKLHVVIGYRKNKTQYKIIKVAEVLSFNDLHDLAIQYNVQFAVLDAMPEQRKCREFQEQEPYRVFLNWYSEHVVQGVSWDNNNMTVRSDRTEICDQTHNIITTDGILEIPRRNDVINIFASHLSNMAKVLEEDKVSGGNRYRYRKLGQDHFYHAMNYFLIAVSQTRVQDSGNYGQGVRFSNWDSRGKEDKNQNTQYFYF